MLIAIGLWFLIKIRGRNRNQQRKGVKSIWVNPYLQMREISGASYQIIPDLLDDSTEVIRYTNWEVFKDVNRVLKSYLTNYHQF